MVRALLVRCARPRSPRDTPIQPGRRRDDRRAQPSRTPTSSTLTQKLPLPAHSEQAAKLVREVLPRLR